MKYYLTEAGSKLFNPDKRKEAVKHIKYFFQRKAETARAEAGEPTRFGVDPTKFDGYKGPGQGHSGPKVVIRKKYGKQVSKPVLKKSLADAPIGQSSQGDGGSGLH